MIGILDTLTLARTKLKTHRVRTFITIGLSSLLFSALVAASIMGTGIFKSISVFNAQSLNNRFLVTAMPDSPLSGSVLGSDTLLDSAVQIAPKIIEKKQAEAKKLDIPYDPNAEISPIITTNIPGQSLTQRHLNLQSPAAQEAIQQYVVAHPSPGIEQLKQEANKYNAIGYYTTTPANANNGQLEIMSGGKEDLVASDSKKVSLDFFHNTSLAVENSNITKPFLVKDTKINNADIPIIVPYSAAERFLGLSALNTTTATSSQRYNRIMQLYRTVASGTLTITACYRNSISADQISQATNQATTNNNSLVYGLPDPSSCGQAPILHDSRTFSERQRQANIDQFNETFGQTVTPFQQKLTFQIVGLTPDTDNDTAKTTLSGFIGNLVDSSLGGGYVIPDDLLNKVDTAQQVRSILLNNMQSTFGAPVPTYTVEFASASDMTNFINNESCTTKEDGSCASSNKLFKLSIGGNNSIVIQEFRNKVIETVTIATIAIIGFAILLMSILVGRSITDSRHETAIFRAIGAQRKDIASIYILYVAMLTLFIIIIALIVGIGASYILNLTYGSEMTLEAKLLFNVVDTNNKFSIFNVSLYPLLALVGAIIISGALSIIVSISRNLARNPMKDLREE